MSNHFNEYFICPHCQSPQTPKNELKERIEAGERYCGACGKEIANALAVALAETIA